MNWRRARCRNSRRGDREFACYPRNPHRGQRRARHPSHPWPSRSVGVGMADGYTRIKRGSGNGAFKAQAGPGDRERLPGIAQAYSENVLLLVIPGRVAAGTAIPAPDGAALPMLHRPVKWSQLAHTVEVRRNSTYAHHAMRMAKAGWSGSKFRRRYGGRIPRRSRLHAGAGGSVRRRSRRDQGGRQDAACGESPVLWPGRALHAEASDWLAALAELILSQRV